MHCFPRDLFKPRWRRARDYVQPIGLLPFGRMTWVTFDWSIHLRAPDYPVVIGQCHGELLEPLNGKVNDK